MRNEVCLNGVWRFIPGGDEHEHEVYVPSQWTHGSCWGYDKSWEKLRNGSYRKELQLPLYHAGNTLLIRFSAVMLKCKVYVGGELIGGHEGGFTPFEVCIPKAFWDRHQQSSVELRVDVESAASAIEGDKILHPISYVEGSADGVLAGGIWQSVFLIERPDIHIFGWTVHYSHGKRTASFEIELANPTTRYFEGALELSIADKDQNVLQRFLLKRVSVKAGGTATARITKMLASTIQEWSELAPHLYVIEISLCEAGGKPLDLYRDRTGFREVVIRGQKLFLNGRSIRMRGFSYIRHKISPYHWRRDHVTMLYQELKNMGINSLRIHASVGPDILFKVADEIGVLLIDQSAIFTTAHTGYRAGGREFLENAKREFTDWYRRDRNHPSIIVWDVENEQIKVDLRNVPWVNELVSHMRTLTTMPVCASAAVTCAADDFVHYHGFDPSRVAGRAKRFNYPFMAGEWYNRNIQEETLRHRKQDVVGSHNFEMEFNLFQPIFGDAEKMDIAFGTDPENPYFKFVETHSVPAHVYTRRGRPFVNPGWVQGKPKVIYDPAVLAEVQAGFAPLVLTMKEENTHFFLGQKSSLTLVLINDTGSDLSGSLSVSFKYQGAEIQTSLSPAGEASLRSGYNKEFSLSIPVLAGTAVAPADVEVVFQAKGGEKATWKQTLHFWPEARLRHAMPMPLYGMGLDAETKKYLKSANIPWSATKSFPAAPAVLLVGSGIENHDPKTIWDFVVRGGRLILLKQEHDPANVLHPFCFKEAADHIHGCNRELIGSVKDVIYEMQIPITDARHPLFRGFPCKAIGPFAGGDHRVVDDVFGYRPESVPDPAFRVLAEKPRLDHGLLFPSEDPKIAIAEICRGEGLVLLNQIHLGGNLKRDPQAQRLLVNMLDYAGRYVRPADLALTPDSVDMAEFEAKHLDADRAIEARKTIPLPLDGDIGKWTDECRDKNVSPWSRAVPYLIQDRNAANGAGQVPGRKLNAGIGYVLYDHDHFYFAMQLLAEEFCFDQVERCGRRRKKPIIWPGKKADCKSGCFGIFAAGSFQDSMRSFMRKLEPSMMTVSPWWRRRSRTAEVMVESPLKMEDHCL